LNTTLNTRGLGGNNELFNRASDTLHRLYDVVHTAPILTFYTEKSQELERVLRIFIRMNSGGTVLSYSDLLLSIAVAQWSKLDARQEIHGLVDELNKIGSGFNLSKDFVLKAGLMLADIASVGFKVENFNRENMAAAIISELGTCLRIIECEPNTPRLVPPELEADRIFDLWDTAQDHIWRAWMVETDPANLQPKLRPLNRRVAEFIRANSPADIDSTRITQALDVVESPWPRREELMLREWFDDETRTGTAKAAYLIDKILETGLEPFREPPTLAPIRIEEIELVCWMAISPALATN
jgi:hypothetical protein